MSLSVVLLPGRACGIVGNDVAVLRALPRSATRHLRARDGRIGE